ncbi:MAG TPA: hypothetical protein PLJ50_08005, partial [Candidatus Latescibacteria bacterium]|nr:hypothetical protein [Candidatus Latescibacterota bacterium]
YLGKYRFFVWEIVVYRSFTQATGLPYVIERGLTVAIPQEDRASLLADFGLPVLFARVRRYACAVTHAAHFRVIHCVASRQR